ncbi:MAG: hypothetical protein IPK64_16205 [bacterium]|nr:hypothetical protein [bacterium]
MVKPNTRMVKCALFLASALILPQAALAADDNAATTTATPGSVDETPTSLPIDWTQTGWSRWELASLDIGYMNGAAYAGLRGFGYHRTWFPGLRRLGLGVDLMDIYAGKGFEDGTNRYPDVATETVCWLPIRLTYVLFGKAKVEQEPLYEILSRHDGVYYTHYTYRDLGSVPRTLVSPLVLVGVATSQWGTRALSNSDFPELEQDFGYWDFFVEASFSTLVTEPPTRPVGAVGRFTAGVMIWDAKGNADLGAMSGTDFYIKVGFGGLAYQPRQ